MMHALASIALGSTRKLARVIAGDIRVLALILACGGRVRQNPYVLDIFVQTF
jgi:hypothetical protein